MKSKINISNIFFIFISEGFCFQRFLKRQCSPSIKNWLYLFYFSKTILILEIWWISVEVAFTRETDCFLISSTSLFSANKKKKTPPPFDSSLHAQGWRRSGWLFLRLGQKPETEFQFTFNFTWIDWTSLLFDPK